MFKASLVKVLDWTFFMLGKHDEILNRFGTMKTKSESQDDKLAFEF